MRKHFLLVVGLAAAVAVPALGQTVASAGEPVMGSSHSSSSVSFGRLFISPIV